MGVKPKHTNQQIIQWPKASISLPLVFTSHLVERDKQLCAKRMSRPFWSNVYSTLQQNESLKMEKLKLVSFVVSWNVIWVYESPLLVYAYASDPFYICLLSYFFDPEVQRAWHMLIWSPICYRQFSPNIRTNYVIWNEISDVNNNWTRSSAVV